MSDIDAIHTVFADWCAARAASERELVRVAALLVSQARSAGHSCVALPLVADCRERLLASGLAGDGNTPTPLVIEGGRLYLYRYWQAECRLAANLRARWQMPRKPMDADATQRFHALFPETSELDHQALAARAALERNGVVITGGPGTGKTTTVARILALLAGSGTQQVALAAPTGKAAQRLRAALLEHLPRCGAINPALTRAAQRASTVHRLLGVDRDGGLRHDAERPLPHDVLVVDEASMLDLVLMDALVAALPLTSQLILLGDAGQLASVEAGNVLGDIAAHDRGGAVVRLTVNHRSRHHPGLAALATALRAGDAAATRAALGDDGQSDVDRCLPEDLDAALELVWPDQQAACAAADAASALQALDQARILTALNDGPWGVEGLNRRVEARLRAAGVDTRHEWYQGRPVLITANDPATRLFNGDLGVCWDGAVHFGDGAGGVRAVAPALLPAHRSAWAMTVHKAQGCEFARVLVVLPESAHPLVTRELVYTAVTRAKSRARLVATDAVLDAACAASAVRASGLQERLEIGLR